MQNNMTTRTKTTWQKAKLGEVLELKYGFGLPEKKRGIGNIPVFGSSGIVGTSDKPAIKSHGIVIGRKGNVGSVYYSEKPFYPIDTVYFVDKLKIPGNLKFFYYFLQKIPFHKIGSDVGVPGLNRDIANSLEVVIPENPSYQKHVTDILSAFDDKIELNNKISRILEQMAQEVFKEWFVNFKFPGHKKIKMIDSELGKIPKGWEVENLEDLVANIVNRYSGDNKRDLKPYVPIDVITSKKLTLENMAKSEDAQSSLIQFHKDDILFGAMRPYFHKVAVAPFDGLTRTTCFILRPRESKYWAFAALFIFSNEAVGYATSHSEGTTIPYAKWSRSFANMPVVKPKDDIAEIYNQYFKPVMRKMQMMAVENQKLDALRDLLLPKLMSGEISI